MLHGEKEEESLRMRIIMFYSYCFINKQTVLCIGVRRENALFPQVHLCTCVWLQKEYSGASHNGPSQERPPTIQRTIAMEWIEFAIDLVNYEPPRSGQPLNSL